MKALRVVRPAAGCMQALSAPSGCNNETGGKRRPYRDQAVDDADNPTVKPAISECAANIEPMIRQHFQQRRERKKTQVALSLVALPQNPMESTVVPQERNLGKDGLHAESKQDSVWQIS